MKKHRLKKRQIIKKSEAFEEIFRVGQRYNSKHLSIFIKDSDKTEFAFAVSKKIRGAVKRNRAKRRLREILRLNQKSFPEKKQFLLLGKPGVGEIIFHILNDELLLLIKNIK